jgi:type II secretory ATPase GspE/PulE/Tfp pilus assembly ATPase PilB-like protein
VSRITLSQQLQAAWQSRIAALSPSDADYAPKLVDRLLQSAREQRASDIHLLPEADGVTIHWRIDGVLQRVDQLPDQVGRRVISRLKVLAQLLTYETETPQEGRIRRTDGEPETRISTFPTMHGEKAVVRLFAGGERYVTLVDLGWPADVTDSVSRCLDQTAGALILTGPAGSGKTTSIYACLRKLVAGTAGGRNLVTLEDPVEVVIPGVTQSQVNPAAGFTLTSGLRSLLRQDPDVIVVGEIRDRETATVAFQGALSGHLLLTTFHAGDCCQALARLADLGIEPYLLRSGLLGLVSQRLVRCLCECAVPGSDGTREPVGCEECVGLGYRGRLLLAEWLDPRHAALGRAILDRAEVNILRSAARESGTITLNQRAANAVREGLTSRQEVFRALGEFHGE